MVLLKPKILFASCLWYSVLYHVTFLFLISNKFLPYFGTVETNIFRHNTKTINILWKKPSETRCCVTCEALWAENRDHFVRRLSVHLSVLLSVCLSGSHTFLVVTHSYVSQATHAFLGMLPFWFPLSFSFFKINSQWTWNQALPNISHHFLNY